MTDPLLSLDDFVPPAKPASRPSRQAQVRWGSRVVTVGGGAPVRVQSMTNTDTVDAVGTASQVKELALAGRGKTLRAIVFAGLAAILLLAVGQTATAQEAPAAPPA